MRIKDYDNGISNTLDRTQEIPYPFSITYRYTDNKKFITYNVDIEKLEKQISHLTFNKNNRMIE